MKKFIKNNLKVVIAFIIGGVIFGGTTLVLAAIGAGQVTYTNNGQSTVEGALDTLYTRANNWIDPSYIDFGTLATNTKKTILASKNGVCIKRNNKVSCFKTNNWSVEKDHIQQVFSDISCDVTSSVNCLASDFYCEVELNGSVCCFDRSDNSRCEVYSNGDVDCR